MKGTVKSVELKRHIDLEERIDECILTIDFDEVYAYYSYNDLLKYLNKEVTYLARVDFVNGNKVLVLCDIAEINHVYTIDKTENVKLYVDDNTRPYCNFALKELKFGEFYPNSIAYLSSFEEGSSNANVHWFDLNCLDKESRTFKLRIFASIESGGMNNREQFESAIGKYIQFDMRLTPYGYQTKEVDVLPWDGASVSPEVALAEQVLYSTLKDDEDLKVYVESKGLIEKVKDMIDGEPGYNLVRMAAELYIIEQLGNISADIDIKVLKRAVFCSRVYLIAKNSRWSHAVFNMNHILRSPALSKDKELLCILDVMAEEPPTATKIAYIKVKQLVDFMVKVRRGESYEEDFIRDYTSVVSRFGGLL